ncbi:uncharacterized protein BJ171DRAFT_224710, partial [Polychytrium aggregatum]|uniref:uncharacterized protein n=1 Tax=Polychytrium aggregatum TaxID=110093 RepID=UPI0022FEFF2B
SSLPSIAAIGVIAIFVVAICTSPSASAVRHGRSPSLSRLDPPVASPAELHPPSGQRNLVTEPSELAHPLGAADPCVHVGTIRGHAAHCLARRGLAAVLDRALWPLRVRHRYPWPVQYCWTKGQTRILPPRHFRLLSSNV